VVVQAGSLAEARETLVDRRLDVAVLDLGLTDGDRRELIGELCRRNHGISVPVFERDYRSRAPRGGLEDESRRSSRGPPMLKDPLASRV